MSPVFPGLFCARNESLSRRFFAGRGAGWPISNGFARGRANRERPQVNGSWKRRPHQWAALVSLLLAVGCGGDPGASLSGKAAAGGAAGSNAASSPAGVNPPATTKPAPADDGPVYHLSYAQPKLPTTRLRLGAFEMDAEVCSTTPQIATGLMFRAGIGPEEGMLFLFGAPHQPAYYMKNVSFDIDVAYINPEGVILEIVRLKAQDRTPVPAKSDRVQFVLETAPDYFAKHSLGPGTLVMTTRGGLKETFLGR